MFIIIVFKENNLIIAKCGDLKRSGFCEKEVINSLKNHLINVACATNIKIEKQYKS